MLNREQVLAALRDVVGLPVSARPHNERTIYEIAGPPGHFHIDYASYPGGTTEEVPRGVIDELERGGLLRRAFPENPKVNGWVLA